MPESDSKKHAMLGMPGYGGLTYGASKGFWRATAGDLSLNLVYSDGSLLAQNFNGLWAAALTRVHRGQPLDYFAMQHSDVAPEDYWLDKLIEEMEDKDLDVLGVVVPIKNQEGVTSLALARDDGDSWSPHCRLTMAEVYDLPETFTSEDVGRPLLLNTGLWVCRFGRDWVNQVHFTINDRIAFSKDRDCYTAQVEPEDWFFSRRCHELGLRIGATRKIAVNHRGEIDFTNTRAWGDRDFDSDYVTERQIPAAVPLEV